jgi:hypothetical protein
MKTTTVLLVLVSDAAFPSLGTNWLCVGFASVLLGLSASLGALLWMLRSAPEGYQDEQGFHFRKTRNVIRNSTGVAMLRPRNAG